jgi:hypothetical protein
VANDHFGLSHGLRKHGEREGRADEQCFKQVFHGVHPVNKVADVVGFERGSLANTHVT